MTNKNNTSLSLAITSHIRAFIIVLCCLVMLPILFTGIYLIPSTVCYHYYWIDENTPRSLPANESAVSCKKSALKASLTASTYWNHYLTKIGLFDDSASKQDSDNKPN